MADFYAQERLESGLQDSQTNWDTPSQNSLTVITNEKKEKYKNKAKSDFESAGFAAMATLPVVTGTGIVMMFNGDKDRFGISDMVRILGLPIAIGGIVIDTIKAPFTILGALAFALKGLKNGFISLFHHDKKVDYQTKEIIDSFFHRFGNTMQILVHLNLETPESILAKMKSKDTVQLSVLCALTTLNTAFASRYLNNNSILLSNGKILHKEHCPKDGLEIFNSVEKLKLVIKGIAPLMTNNKNASGFIMPWIPLIKGILENKIKIEDAAKNLSEQNLVYLKSIITTMTNVGELITDKKEFVKKIDSSLQSTSATQLQLQPIIDNKQIVFLDVNNKDIVHPAVYKDGLLYEYNSKSYCQKHEIIKFYHDQNLDIDPITTQKIKDAVIANDGHLYDLSTVQEYKSKGFRGFDGSIISHWIPCRVEEWKFRIVEN
jgi:hypothetical protein